MGHIDGTDNGHKHVTSQRFKSVQSPHYIMLIDLVHLAAIARMITMVLTTDHCQRIFSVPDHILQGHVIRTLPGKSFESCTIECEREARCYSINYITPLTTCQLNDATDKKYPRDFVTWPDAVYIRSLVRAEVKTNPCLNRVPPCDGLCIVDPGSRKATCVCIHDDLSACSSDTCKPQALGMENRGIKDSQLQASSVHPDSSLNQARLRSVDSWTPITDDSNQWFEVTFDSQTKIVTAIATQGHSAKYWWWVMSYKMKYKRKTAMSWDDYMDKNTNQPKVFTGNSDQNSVVKNTFTPPIIADSVKIMFTRWTGRIALRFELYGCGMVQ